MSAAISKTAPPWLQPLLFMAAEAQAQQLDRAATRVTFKMCAGKAEDTTYTVQLDCNAASARFRLVVTHEASGQFVCASQWVEMDALDPEEWNTDPKPDIGPNSDQSA